MYIYISYDIVFAYPSTWKTYTSTKNGVFFCTIFQWDTDLYNGLKQMDYVYTLCM